MSAIQQLLPTYKLAGDPYFSNVSLLLHMDGTNGSTTFTDSSPSPKIITRTGATIATSQSKFGGASGYFSSSADRLTAPSSSAFEFGSGDWTVELFIYPLTLSGFHVLVDRGDYTNFSPWLIGQNNATIRLACTASGSSWSVDFVTGNVLSASTWHHIAVTRSGNVFRIFVNGVQQGTQTVSMTHAASTFPMQIGNDNGNTYYYSGYMDEVRITKGVARYTSGFSVPTEAFPNS